MSSLDIIDIWNKITTPKSGFSVRAIPQTNAYLAKNSDGRFTIYIASVKDAIPKRGFRHLNIAFEKSMYLTLGKNKQEVKNCLMLTADESVESELMPLIMKHLVAIEPKGDYKAKHLFEVLNKVEHLVKRPEKDPTKEEVVGAWGELYILHHYLKKASTFNIRQSIISSWEGDSHQEKIDFRFNHAGYAMEVKTTLLDIRKHHIHGLQQVETPQGFTHGVMASLLIEEARGPTCKKLLDDIRSLKTGSTKEKIAFLEMIEKRVKIRGNACEDDRFMFSLIDNGLAFYPLESVPRPDSTSEVEPIEWISNLSVVQQLTPAEKQAMDLKISS